MLALHKKTKNKASMLKIGVSCYFHSCPRGAFRTQLTIYSFELNYSGVKQSALGGKSSRFFKMKCVLLGHSFNN